MKKISTLLLFLTIVLLQVSGQSATGSIEGTVTTSDNKPAEGITVLASTVSSLTGPGLFCPGHFYFCGRCKY